MTIDIGQSERTTQNRVVALFREELGYRYLGNLQGLTNKNIREADLLVWLAKRGVSDALAQSAVKSLQDLNYLGGGRRLYDANGDIYQLLRYGAKVKTGAGEHRQTVLLVDWENPQNNDFAVAEEVSIPGSQYDKRPDVVLYLNGIAVAVLELKRSSVSVSEGIRQNIANQQREFCETFFTTVQLLFAGNDSEGLRYGVIETPEKYYLKWKEDGAPDNLGDLDADLCCMCEKSRFLEILHDFMVFDNGAKKTCRPNQYFGIKAAQARLNQRQGGIIWHTQGSGKSLTMVWLAQWILERGDNHRVLIITDRTELDEQIKKVFENTQNEIYRTKSGKDLLNVLNENKHSLICSLVHKFGSREETQVINDEELNAFLNDIRTAQGGFSPKGKIVVFVDECHRTQSGKLHEAMKSLLPNAIFVGFTGTPLLKTDKKQSVEVFGGFIHTYKFNEAVKDGVVLDLLYEARDIEQSLSSPKRVDDWFEAKTRGMTDIAKTQLKQRWGTMQKLLSSKNRLEKIVDDILLDMEIKPRLSDGSGNAILVCASVYQACQCYELFAQSGLKNKVAIVTSFKPDAQAAKNAVSAQAQNEELFKYSIYRKMIADYYREGEEKAAALVEQFETDVKKRFIEQPAQMKLLIVVDKLLTGFDAPSATYLYIDKKMADHNLFQAICRVNRLDGESKTYGYVVDYRDLFKSLEKAFKDFTQEAFGNYEPADVEGLIKDRLSTAKEDLETAWEAVQMMTENVLAPKTFPEYKAYFCGADDKTNLQTEYQSKRLAFYRAAAKLIRAYGAIANELVEAGYNKTQAEEWHKRVKNITDLRDELKIASGDYVDFKTVDADMRYLINQYVRAEDSERLDTFDNVGLLDLLVSRGADIVEDLPEDLKDKESMAETIENNIRKTIVDENPTNPKYFEKMSVLLDELIEQRKQEVIDYKKYLEEMARLAEQVKRPQGSNYPKEINTPGKQAIFDNFSQDTDWVLSLDHAIQTNKQDGYLTNKMKQKRLKAQLKPLTDEKGLDIDEVFELIIKQTEYGA